MRIPYISGNNILRSFNVAFISLVLSYSLLAQVSIRDSIILSPSTNGFSVSSSTSGRVVTVRFTYGYCGGSASLFISGSPCNAYHQRQDGTTVTGNNPPQNGVATFSFVAYDYGSYSFDVELHNVPTCVSNGSSCTGVCPEYTSIGDQFGPPGGGSGRGGSYFNPDQDCVVNDPQPQLIDESSIVSLQDNSTYSWTDATGPHTSSVYLGCAFDTPGVGMIDLGLTYMFTRIPQVGPSPTSYYDPLSDIVIRPCKTAKSGGGMEWIFRVENIRIPIYESTCSPAGWVDLADGLNWNVLSANIHNCGEYLAVDKELNYFIAGTHNVNNPFGGPNAHHWFSPGVVKHEEQHRKDRFERVKERLNKEIFPLTYGMRAPVDPSSCAKAAVEGYQGNIHSNLQMGYSVASSDSIDDAKADKAAAPVYTDIQSNIKKWAKVQSWWKIMDGCH